MSQLIRMPAGTEIPVVVVMDARSEIHIIHIPHTALLHCGVHIPAQIFVADGRYSENGMILAVIVLDLLEKLQIIGDENFLGGLNVH